MKSNSIYNIFIFNVLEVELSITIGFPYPFLCAAVHKKGKIERYHRSMKNLILMDHYYSPLELEERIREWVDYYNNHRYHEAIDNVTPSDRFYGKDKEILEQRQRTKIETMSQRRKIYRSFLINNLMGDLN